MTKPTPLAAKEQYVVVAGVPDTDNWQQLTNTPQGSYFQVEPRVIATVPRPGAEHTVEVAREQLGRLHDIVRRSGERHGLIVFVDPVVRQDAGARRIWSQELDETLIVAVALACRSLFARAVGSFFIGLRRPAVPIRMLREFPAALDWIRAELKRNGGPVSQEVAD